MGYRLLPIALHVGRGEGIRALRVLPVVLASAALVVFAVSMAGCGGGGGSSTSSGASSNLIRSHPANGKTTITVGSKNFTEEFVLGQIYAQALRAAGYKVKTRLNLGSEKVALKAVKEGQISGYPEYTSTALGSFFSVPANEIPNNANAAYSRPRPTSPRRGSSRFRRPRSPTRTRSGHSRRRREKLGLRDISDLDRQVAGPRPRRIAGVSRADRLPRRPGEELRPQVQAV